MALGYLLYGGFDVFLSGRFERPDKNNISASSSIGTRTGHFRTEGRHRGCPGSIEGGWRAERKENRELPHGLGRTASQKIRNHHKGALI